MKPIALALAAIILLAGCASLSPSQPEFENQAAWNKRLAKLSQIRGWELTGRMSLRNDEEAYQASLRWIRKQFRHRIDLTGPFGRGYIRLRQDRSGAEMRDSDKNIFRAENIETLLRQKTGWDIPLQGMEYWVLGLPMPDQAMKMQLDRHGRLKRLSQKGWDIRFIEYRRYGDIELPRKIFLSRGQGHNPTGEVAHRVLELRLVINHWQLPPTPRAVSSTQ